MTLVLPDLQLNLQGVQSSPKALAGGARADGEIGARGESCRGGSPCTSCAPLEPNPSPVSPALSAASPEKELWGPASAADDEDSGNPVAESCGAGTRPAEEAALRADAAWESRSRRRYGNCKRAGESTGRDSGWPWASEGAPWKKVLKILGLYGASPGFPWHCAFLPPAEPGLNA